jgi:hypothetical protein
MLLEKSGDVHGDIGKEEEDEEEGEKKDRRLLVY